MSINKVKIFYDNDISELEDSINEFINKEGAKIISSKLIYLEDNDKNPHKCFLTYLIVYTSHFFKSKHFEND